MIESPDLKTGPTTSTTTTDTKEDGTRSWFSSPLSLFKDRKTMLLFSSCLVAFAASIYAIPTSPLRSNPSRTPESASASAVHLPSFGSISPFVNSTFSRPILAYHQIPYATPPTGSNRFRYPTRAPKWKRTLNHLKPGPVCLQGDTPAAIDQSEDCLTLDIYKPVQSAKGNKGKGKLLPVVIWVPGGLFVLGSGRTLNLPSMVANAPVDYIGVSINYRIGALGFLPSNLTARANLLNIGFQDQLFAFKWVQENIEYFGGDPNEVTLFGESAGAHSVGYHWLHIPQAGEKKLFKRVIMDSGGPTARAFPKYTQALQNSYSLQFIKTVGCENGDDAEKTFDCLRKVDVGLIKATSNALVSRPVVDGKYIKSLAHISLESGQFQTSLSVLTGSNTDDGSTWFPQTISTDQDFRAWWQNLLPNFNNTLLDELEAYYPMLPGDDQFPFAAQWGRGMRAYGAYAYISSTQENALRAAQFATKGAKVFRYRFDAIPQTAQNPLGSAHVTELPFVTANSSVIPSRAAQMNAYWSSYIVSGDPNTYRLRGSPKWPIYTTKARQQLRFGQSVVEVEKDGPRDAACAWWRGMPNVLEH